MVSADKLTEKQEAFCQYYAQLSDTYNNGTWSYALGYGHDLENASKVDYELDDKNHKIPYSSSYDKMANMCAVEAHRLLRTPKIIERVRDIKSTHVEDDKIIDSRMMDIIQNGKDTDALAAIKHRNDLKQRVTRKVELDVNDPRKQILDQYMGGDDAGKKDS
jgi:phage terminase small subunit